MTFRRFSNLLRFCTLVMLVSGLSPLFAQGPAPEEPAPTVDAATPVVLAPSQNQPPHRFWDKQNRALFVAAAASNAADFGITRANLQSGGQELNPIVRMFGRSTPVLALNFAGEAASTVAISYFFHRAGHHRLERVVSLVNIGGSVGAVTYGLTHR